MSYDYFFFKSLRNVTDLNELKEDALVPLGPAAVLRDQVGSVVSGIEWMDWGGALQVENGWLEFRITETQASELGFTIRSSHHSDHRWEDSVMRQLCVAHGWSALDSQNYRLIDAAGIRQMEVPGNRAISGEVADVARAILDERRGIFDGCRALAHLGRRLLDWRADPDFSVIVAFDSDANRFPREAVRHLWDPTALAEFDVEREEFERRSRSEVMTACRSVLARYERTSTD